MSQQDGAQATTVAQQELAMLMAQMRDAVVHAANAAQNSATALEAMRQERQGDGVRGIDLAKVLNKPERFPANTRDEELAMWRTWSWNFLQWLSAIDADYIGDINTIKGALDVPVAMTDMTSATRTRSLQLYSILASVLHECGRAVLRAVADQNGYEAFRVLEADLAPTNKSRHLAILAAISSYPSFNPKISLMQQVLKLE